MSSYVTSQEELRKAGRQEWDIEGCWSVEEERLAGDLRNTVAGVLDKGQPGIEARCEEALSRDAILRAKQSFHDDHCKRPCAPIRPELIQQGIRGDLRAVSPRKAAIAAWRAIFWASVTIPGMVFIDLVLRRGEPATILWWTLFIIFGAWLVGYGIAKFLIKNHIEHPSNNLIYRIDENNVNRRESDITSPTIYVLLVIGVSLYGLGLWFLARSSAEPYFVTVIGAYSGLIIIIAEALHSYKKDIRRRLLQVMFTAQSMYAIDRHMQYNPPLKDGDILPDDQFVQHYRDEINRQYSTVSSRFN